MKHVYAFVPILFSLETLINTSPNSNSTTTVLESQVYDRFALNKVGLSPHTNVFGCLTWCKGITETILKYAKQTLDYSITIFRLPPHSFWSITEPPSLLELRRKPCVMWNCLKTAVWQGQLPQLPTRLYGLLIQPFDEAIRATVELSLAPRRVHWIYHMVDDKQLNSFTIDCFADILHDLGIYLKSCSVTEWLAAVEAHGSESPLGPLLPHLQELIQNTSLCANRSVTFSNTHVTQDLSLIGKTLTWQPFNEYVKVQIRHLLHSHFFPPESLGTLNAVEEMMTEATRIAGGLTNFGPHIDLCLEGWRLFLQSIKSPEQPMPTFWGRASITRTFLVYLTTHLYLTERERVCPRILEEQIKAPIFVVGLNRAGTTFVHSLLGQDHQNHRCPVLLEMLYPYGEKGDHQPVGVEANDVATWEQDPRRAAATELITLQMGGEMRRKLEPLHNRYAISYEEDLVAFDLVGRSYSMIAGFQADAFCDWLFENDGEHLRQAYPFHRRLFQHLQYQRPGKRWIFKMPWHLWTVETLFDTYPDAELICIHRRPVSAVQSWCGLELLLQSNYLVSADLRSIGERGLKIMSLIVKKALEYQEGLAMKFVQEHPDLQPPQSFFYNLYFDQVIENPIVCIKEIYEGLDLNPLSIAAESSMWAFMEEASKHRSAVAKLHPSCDLADVGLTRKDIRAAFASYYATYFDKAQRERRLQEFRTAKAIRRNEVQREKHYDENGSMLIGGPSLLKQTGLDQARRNMETMLSYAKTKLLSPLQNND
eukprot:Protomagalhaensia_sp_Gyna_25__5269@NODE_64_length_5726_cov_52_732724_g47_i0_p1_GENE_NODE_64_length_5726_cov_52_732724_g47_i0NODE_64_length_5726_cov_52_732724_g47_i0_p1_ORF_typecomplete_len765_score94_43Sulfotransfer_3/PF13469_6/6_8e23Sulfotransfer_3/PF13469_6/1_3e04Sulfotransfer_1/PF00685_27/2_6e05CMAS/PF02353_20/0_087Sulfotransfer_4/PF17784_1/0_62Sulfotransfer_4/PF17784_1/2_5e03_NODE_64_length_5726_cov_52_732724_g47_i09203214